jgi:hypothetical protein
MEGEHYVMSSSLWPALKGVEDVLAPHAGDSPPIAQLRHLMNLDHTRNRVTLASSIQQPLHVFMHLLDPRFVAYLPAPHLLSICLFSLDVLVGESFGPLFSLPNSTQTRRHYFSIGLLVSFLLA